MRQALSRWRGSIAAGFGVRMGKGGWPRREQLRVWQGVKGDYRVGENVAGGLDCEVDQGEMSRRHGRGVDRIGKGPLVLPVP
jgi:hypothetical protein